MTDREPSRSLKNRPKVAPPRVFLGSLVIAPGAQEGSGAPVSEALQIRLIDALMELVSLPRIEDRKSANAEDLAVDITVPHYRTGRLFNRPQVVVAARLYHLDTGQTIFADDITETAGWGKYLRRILRPKYFLNLRPVFSPEEMEALLIQATTHLLTRVNSQV